MILAPILLKLEALGIKWQMDVPKACYVGKMSDRFYQYTLMRHQRSDSATS
ncbi:hypothetical protein HMP0721_0316 [Pseudoramibacter alactolyticus ATCC 23263]|uniref:Uncharacterized protein n=1 Tax=Pseudoramibacter alactolyticus ATCC 23263 TaxID=887929 RepID=E6ME83_9FIRM|nr:hypothetical protein HMP0721_0316 [Pseudoramibacter alactolyticus ATCC 23263]